MNEIAIIPGDIKQIICKLKAGELKIRDVPSEFELNMDVVRTERELGLRKSCRRGFDVTSQKFFVEELWYYDLEDESPDTCKQLFDSFKEYYEFLDGDVYSEACYYQYDFEDEFLRGLELDINKLKTTQSFTTETIDDFSCLLSKTEVEEFKNHEKIKKLVKQWLKKFVECDTYEQFLKMCCNYEKSVLAQYICKDFFLFQYAFNARMQQNHLDVIMEYLSNDGDYVGNITVGLCLIYKPEEILERYDFSQASAATNKKRRKNLKNFVEELGNSDVDIKKRGYFDKITHFYCEEIKVYRYRNCQGRKILNSRCDACVTRAFESFREFIEHRNGDLRDCDLSGAISLHTDFSEYRMDSTTILPITQYTNISYEVQKMYENGMFSVEQFWRDISGKIIKQQQHKFSYFFDFVAFLKGDLSGANLIFCTGMKYLSNIDGIDLRDVKMLSALCEQLDVSYEEYNYDKGLINEFFATEKNEEETSVVLQSSRDEISVTVFENDNRVGYISDLHLMHRIQNAGCKSEEDIIYTLQKIVDGILSESSTLTLIGGDVASEFSIFELFVKLLKRSVDRQRCTEFLFEKRDFIFILGNHELWNFSGSSVEDIANKYRTVLEENGMYFLHNDLFYKNESDDMGVIPYDELITQDNSAIWERLRCTRLVILGGLGFSGYNEMFNANNGIYRATVDRRMEIRESKKFEQLYVKLMEILDRKNTIIFTHTPKKDWSADITYHENFVYVSGHTHRNMFFDDGVERVYADNQIGYRNECIHIKNFLIDGTYDYFGDYEDGIYEITSQQYQDFSRGKNIPMTFNRKINILYMLKKNGYYCFIHETQAGVLQILNGGAIKKLRVKDVKYYYDNMDAMITYIRIPLDKYISYQKRISNEIKKIGGSGRIHGCIIDVDFYNHVYVNPGDMSVTAYWAYDVILKYIYSDIPTLLKEKCPILYSNYLLLLELQEKTDSLVMAQPKNKISIAPQLYLETDIYRVSREIKKMQKLNSNILTTWYEITSDGIGLPLIK